jgi:hypothetical protein
MLNKPTKDFMSFMIKHSTRFLKPLVLISLVFLFTDLAAQVSGNTTVAVGEITTYEFYSDDEGFNPNWDVTYPQGTKVATYNNSSWWYVDIRWDYPGPATVYVYNSGVLRGSLNVVVSGCPTPQSPGVTLSVSSNQCGDKTVSYVGGPDNGITWYWQYGQLGVETFNSSNTIVLNQSRPVYLRARNDFGCWSDASQSPTANVNVFPIPNIYPVTGGGSYCTGNSNVTISLSGYQAGIFYQLKNGAANVQAPDSTNPITWNNVAAGTGNYSIVASYNGGVCPTNMGNTVSVTENAIPALFQVTGGGAYCAGSAGKTIFVSGSQSNFTYTLINTSTNQNVATFAGNDHSFSWPGITVASGTQNNFIVQAKNNANNTCASYMGSVDITLNLLPAVKNVGGGGTGCANSMYNIYITLDASQPGINYQLYTTTFGVQADVPLGILAGNSNGSGLSWQASAGAGYYIVKATNSTTNCSVDMLGYATVSQSADPLSFALTGGGSYCSNNITGVGIKLAGSVTGTTYTLLRDGVPYPNQAGSTNPRAGNGSELNWTAVTAQGSTGGSSSIFSVLAANNSFPYCSITIFGSPAITVSVIGSPVNYGMSGSTYCSPGEAGATVVLSNSQTGVNYQLMQGSSPVGPANPGATNSSVQWPGTTAGTYSVVATTAVGNCTITMSQTALVNTTQGSVGGTLTLPVSEGYGSVATVGYLLVGKIGLLQQWERNTGSGWVATTAAALENITISAQYRVGVKNSFCPVAYSTVVPVTVYPVPVITYSGPNYIGYPAGSTTLVGSSGYYEYIWFNKDQQVASTQSLTVNSAGFYSLKVRATATAPYYETRAQVYTPMGLSNMNYHSVTNIVKNGKKDADNLNLAISDFAMATEYQDGLGRTTQSVLTGQSPLQKDIVAPVVYDAQGRVSKSYLPYVSTASDGGKKANDITSGTGYAGSEQYLFYQNTSKVAPSTAPYTSTLYEPGPLGRVTEQGATGADWQPGGNHTLKKRYEVNAANEICLFAYNANTGLVSLATGDPGFYGAGQLMVSKTTDENGNEVIEYVDKIGHTVCKKVQYDVVNSVKQYTNTYYLYDDSGNLVVVLPPEAVKGFTGN